MLLNQKLINSLIILIWRINFYCGFMTAVPSLKLLPHDDGNTPTTARTQRQGIRLQRETVAQILEVKSFFPMSLQ